MGIEELGAVHDLSEGGIAGSHPEEPPLELLLASSNSADHNTARLRLIPIACWRIEDIRFAFDSSFVTADIRQEVTMLIALREEHKRPDGTYPPLSIFGHADPVGSDDYNKGLSGRRAAAIYALLIHNKNPSQAESLWSHIAIQEQWGASQRAVMLTATGLPDNTGDSALRKAYLALLCPASLQLTEKDFLARGADSGGKGDYQGCSEFNPLVIFSAKAEKTFEADEDKQARNKANQTNRRVLILLFRPGSRVEPAHWPCPRVSEGTGG